MNNGLTVRRRGAPDLPEENAQNARKTGKPRFAFDSSPESRQPERACSDLAEGAIL